MLLSSAIGRDFHCGDSRPSCVAAKAISALEARAANRAIKVVHITWLRLFVMRSNRSPGAEAPLARVDTASAFRGSR